MARDEEGASLDLRHNPALESIAALGGLTGGLPGGITIDYYIKNVVLFEENSILPLPE